MDGGNGSTNLTFRLVAVPAVLYVTEAELAKQLAYRNVDDPRLTQVCADATDEINHACGGIVSDYFNPLPATVANVALSLGVDLWKNPDATFGIMGLGETGPVRTPRELIGRYITSLIPYFITPDLEPTSSGGWSVA
jgi:hypothetical protein